MAIFESTNLQGGFNPLCATNYTATSTGNKFRVIAIAELRIFPGVFYKNNLYRK